MKIPEKGILPTAAPVSALKFSSQEKHIGVKSFRTKKQCHRFCKKFDF